MFITRNIFLLILVMIIAISLSAAETDTIHGSPVRIAFSRCSGSANALQYVKWIHHVDSSVVCINLYGKRPDSALLLLQDCDGLVLTGGPDVNPARYGKVYDSSRCKMDDKRDTLEFALIRRAAELQIPILAICRGQQIMNVACKGDLTVDIPDDIGRKVIHSKEGDSCMHKITIDTASLLYRITGKKSGEVNSYHHQAIHRLAPDLKITSTTADGIPESVEWRDPRGKPFFLAVQWHPEKLPFDHPFSTPLAACFLKELVKHRTLKDK